MADGMFDDLVPANRTSVAPTLGTVAPAEPTGGMFDDLVPSGVDFSGVQARIDSTARPAIPNVSVGEPVPVALGEVIEPEGMAGMDVLGGILGAIANPAAALGQVTRPLAQGIANTDFADSFQRGAAGAVAGTAHTLGDFIDLTVQQANPLRAIGEAAGNEQLVDAFTDPLGARALANDALGANREIAADRDAAMAAIGDMPGIVDYLASPAAALATQGERLGTMGAESAPLFAAALATRNPQVGAGLMGGVTGGQTFTDLRGEGVGRGDAGEAAILSALAEAAGEGVSLPRVMGRDGLAQAIAAEAGQEAGVQLAQTNIADQATGRETPIAEQLLGALEAAGVGGLLGGAGYAGSNAPNLLAGDSAPPAATTPPAAPRNPEVLGDPGPAPQPRAQDEAVAPEDDADLAELLVRNLLDPAVAAELGIEPDAAPAPILDEARIAAALGDPEPADPDARFRRPAPESAPAAPPALEAPEVRTSQPAQILTPEESGQASAPQSAPAGAGADLAPKKPRKPAAKRDKAGKPMDMLRVIAANGGLNREAFRAQGIDPAEFTRRAGFNYVFRKNGGMGLGELREFMQQEGYLARDPEDGIATVDDNDALDLFDRAFRSGDPIYSEDQGDAVAEYEFARRQADEEYQAEWEADQALFGEDEFTGEIASLTERLYDLGVSDSVIVGVAFDSESKAQHVDTLRYLVENLENDRAEQAEQAQAGDRGAEPGQEAEPEPGFSLEADPAPRAQEVAPPPSAGLFGAPSARDFIDDAQRSRDARRDGKTATGRTDMLAGDGELFAGARPAQARVPDADPVVAHVVAAFDERPGAALNMLNDAGIGKLMGLVGINPGGTYRAGNISGHRGSPHFIAKEAITADPVIAAKAREEIARVAGDRRFVKVPTVKDAKATPPEPDESLESVEPSIDLRPTQGTAEKVIGDTRITYGVSRDGKTVEVTLIRTPKAKQGQGSARHAMEALLAEADANGQRVVLTPEPMGAGASKAQLESFYRSLGFKPNKGRSRDFTTRAAMIREPSVLESVEEQTDSPAFKRWSQGAALVTDMSDYEGGPAVFRLLHGTTASFDSFDRERANVESDFGAGFYFTNNPADVSENYAGLGPDLTNKIQREAERIAGERDLDYDAPEVVAEARARWVQNEGSTMPVFVRALNPAIVGGDSETVFTFEEPYNEELDEYGEPEGTLLPVLEALRDIEADGEFSDFDAEKVIDDIFGEHWDGDSIGLNDMIGQMKGSEGLVYATDNDSGDMAASEIIRQVLERAGFDAVVDFTVDMKFGSQRSSGQKMAGMDSETVHVIAFNPTQIKSSIGNSGAFDPADPSILASEEAAELSESDLTPSERAAFRRSRDPRSRSDAALARVSVNVGNDEADLFGLREAVNKALGRAGEKVIYLGDYDGLPDYLRRGVDARRDQRGGQGRTAALYDARTKDVYLFTNVVTDPDRAVWNAAHEIAGHEGLRTLLGDSLDNALNIAMQNPTVAKLADAIAAERKLRGDQRLLATEEALAELAAAVRTGDYAHIESRYNVPVPEGIRAKVARAVENFLRRLKALFDRNGQTFTDEQVRELLEAAWQAVDGNAATAADQTQTPAFRRWFGDSKVVDENGNPLVVYHGTINSDGGFDVFDRTAGRYATHARSINAVGSWFTSSSEDARVFSGATNPDRFAPGGQTYAVYLSIKKPFPIKDGDHLAKLWQTHAGGDGNLQNGDPDKFRAWAESRGIDGFVLDAQKIDRFAEAGSKFYIALAPEQIKSATGNSGAFDPESDSILESVAESGNRAEQRRNEAADTLEINRGAAGWNYDTGAWEGRKGELSRARASLQDKMLSWRDVQNQIASQVGQAIPDAQNVYRLENLMHGRVKEGLDRIEEAQILPLMEAMKAAGVKPAALEEYLYARHAKERNAKIAEINPAMPDGGSGMTNAEADAILAGADKAKLDPLAKRIDAMTRATRRRLLQHGLITQEQHDAMEAQYSAYVPLKGKETAETDFEASSAGPGRGLDTRAQPVKQALGRGAGNRATDIIANVIADSQRSVILAEKARVGRAVMRLVLANPNPALWQVEPVQTERAVDAAGEVYERVVSDWSDPSIVAVRHRGQLYKVQINNKAMAMALNNVGVDQLGTITRYAGAINRYFSAVLTKYNPAFIPVNASRDALFGLVGLASEHGEAAALDAALHYPLAARAAFRQSIRKSGDGQWDTWAKEFANAGGKTGYVAMPSAEDLARKIGKGGLSSYSPDGLAKAARALGDAVGSINDAVENALRLSAYVTLRKRGMSTDAAAEYAKNLTVNFNRKGMDGSKFNAWFLFYNASMQGAHRVSKLLRNKKAWAYTGGLVGVQVMAAMAAMGMEGDDGEPLWNKVPDHVKRRNIVIVTPDGGVVTIPMPYGLNVFTYAAGRLVGALLDEEHGKPTNRAGAITGDLLSATVESFSPVPIGEGGLGLLPTALRIPVNVQTNRNDFGHRIRNEAPYSKFDIPRASMGRPDTLEVFKLIATGMNRIGGGDEYTPPSLSWFDVAPEDVEYLLGELTGGAGRFITDAATWAQKATGDLPMKPQDRPIIKRFVTSIDEQASQNAMFYDRRDTIARSLEKLRDTFQNDGAEAAEKMLAAMPELKGAAFRRRKNASERGPVGSIITSDGRPQIVVKDDDAVFGKYKAAEKAAEFRNESVRDAYTRTPGSLLPSKESRMRDNITENLNTQRQFAQHEFNKAWTRDVVGSAE